PDTTHIHHTPQFPQIERADVRTGGPSPRNIRCSKTHEDKSRGDAPAHGNFSFLQARRTNDENKQASPAIASNQGLAGCHQCACTKPKTNK
ncbi:MAG: hypothetical protein L6R35_006381, partial [Caloplaca aegaea]